MGRQFYDKENLFQNNNDAGGAENLEDHVQSRLQFLLGEGSKAPMLLSKNPGLPPWFDYELFVKGQHYFHNNYYAFFTAKLSGLLTILAIPSILGVLEMTNQSTLPVTAFKRYLTTISQMLRWYDGDLLEPTSSAHKSLMEVRARHRSASLRSGQVATGSITQLDMMLTQFGFMGYSVIAPKRLGLCGSDEDVEGFVHFWRTIGFMLGIEDRFNLCSGSLEETRLLCQKLNDQVFVPALQSPPPGFLPMAKSLVDGMWVMVPFLNLVALFNFTAFLAGISPHTFKTPEGMSGLYSSFFIALQRWIHTVVLANKVVGWLVRKYLNAQMWFTVVWTQSWPVLAFATFGREQVECPMTYH